MVESRLNSGVEGSGWRGSGDMSGAPEMAAKPDEDGSILARHRVWRLDAIVSCAGVGIAPEALLMGDEIFDVAQIRYRLALSKNALCCK